jgi:hypothetical protein
MPSAQNFVEAVLPRAFDHRRFPYLCDPASAFVTPKLVELARLWQTKRAGRDMPGRADFDLRDLTFVSSNLAIVDIVPGEGAPRHRVRLMGSTLDRYVGPMTGRFIDEALPPALAAKWAAIFSQSAAARAPSRWFGRVEVDGKDHFIFEKLCAPLAADHVTPDALMVSTHFHGRFQLDTCTPEQFVRLTVEVDAAARH